MIYEKKERLLNVDEFLFHFIYLYFYMTLSLNPFKPIEFTIQLCVMTETPSDIFKQETSLWAANTSLWCPGFLMAFSIHNNAWDYFCVYILRCVIFLRTIARENGALWFHHEFNHQRLITVINNSQTLLHSVRPLFHSEKQRRK